MKPIHIPRLCAVLFVCLGAAVGWHAAPAFAEEAAAPASIYADAEETAEALKAFEVGFKARGFKGDEKLMHKDHALRELAAVPHPKIADRLLKVAAKDRSSDVRLAALQSLALMKPLASYAGQGVAKLVLDKRLGKEPTHALACVTTLERLGYLMSADMLRELLTSKDYAVRKHALSLMGMHKDPRLLEQLWKELGTIAKDEQGDSYDGAEASVDTGTAGDGDQRAAEAKAKGEAAGNRGGMRKAGGRATSRDLKPHILEALRAMTGQDFVGAKDAKAWFEANAAIEAELKASIDERVAQQQAAIDDAKAALKRKR